MNNQIAKDFANQRLSAAEWALIRKVYAETYPVRPLLNHVDELVETVCKMRDLLLGYAKECIRCDGTGMVTVEYDDGEENHQRVEECDECADLREVLA